MSPISFDASKGLDRAEVGIHSSIDQASAGIGATTLITWQGDEATHVDVLMKRVSNIRGETYTDVIVNSWTPYHDEDFDRTTTDSSKLGDISPYDKPISLLYDARSHKDDEDFYSTIDDNDTLVYEESEIFNEPYVEPLFHIGEFERMLSAMSLIFKNENYFYEDYMEELFEIETISMNANEVQMGVQTDIILGDLLMSESISSLVDDTLMQDDRGFNLDHSDGKNMLDGNEDSFIPIKITDNARESPSIHSYMRNILVYQLNKIITEYETPGETIHFSTSIKSNIQNLTSIIEPSEPKEKISKPERTQSEHKTQLSKHNIIFDTDNVLLIHDRKTSYYEPYMAALLRMNIKPPIFPWSFIDEPDDVPDMTVVDVPMWTEDLIVKPNEIQSQFVEDWERRVYEQHLSISGELPFKLPSEYSNDKTMHGFNFDLTPDILSVSSKEIKKCPEILNLFNYDKESLIRQNEISSSELPYKGIYWVASNNDMFYSDLITALSEKAVCVHLPDEDKENAMVLQFGKMNLILSNAKDGHDTFLEVSRKTPSCQPMTGGRKFQVETKLKFNFIDLDEKSMIHHTIRINNRETGLITKVIMRCKGLTILPEGVNMIINKDLFVDPKGMFERVVTYELLKDNQEKTTFSKTIRQGGSPFFLNIPNISNSCLGSVGDGKKLTKLIFEIIEDGVGRRTSKLLELGGIPLDVKLPLLDETILCKATLCDSPSPILIGDIVHVIDINIAQSTVFFKDVEGGKEKIISSKRLRNFDADVFLTFPFDPPKEDGEQNISTVIYKITKNGVEEEGEDVILGNAKPFSFDFQVGPISTVENAEPMSCDYYNAMNEHYIMTTNGKEQLRLTQNFLDGHHVVTMTLPISEDIIGLLELPSVVTQKHLALSFSLEKSPLHIEIPITSEGFNITQDFKKLPKEVTCQAQINVIPCGVERCDEKFRLMQKDSNFRLRGGASTTNANSIGQMPSISDMRKITFIVRIDGEEASTGTKIVQPGGSPLEIDIPVSNSDLQLDSNGRQLFKFKLVEGGEEKDFYTFLEPGGSHLSLPINGSIGSDNVTAGTGLSDQRVKKVNFEKECIESKLEVNYIISKHSSVKQIRSKILKNDGASLEFQIPITDSKGNILEPDDVILLYKILEDGTVKTESSKLLRVEYFPPTITKPQSSTISIVKVKSKEPGQLNDPEVEDMYSRVEDKIPQEIKLTLKYEGSNKVVQPKQPTSVVSIVKFQSKEPENQNGLKGENMYSRVEDTIPQEIKLTLKYEGSDKVVQPKPPTSVVSIVKVQSKEPENQNGPKGENMYSRVEDTIPQEIKLTLKYEGSNKVVQPKPPTSVIAIVKVQSKEPGLQNYSEEKQLYSTNEDEVLQEIEHTLKYEGSNKVVQPIPPTSVIAIVKVQSKEPINQNYFQEKKLYSHSKDKIPQEIKLTLKHEGYNKAVQPIPPTSVVATIKVKSKEPGNQNNSQEKIKNLHAEDEVPQEIKPILKYKGSNKVIQSKVFKPNKSPSEIEIPLNIENLEASTQLHIIEDDDYVIKPIETTMKIKVLKVQERTLNTKSSKPFRGEEPTLTTSRPTTSVVSIFRVQTNGQVHRKNIPEQIIDSPLDSEQPEELACVLKYEGSDRVIQSKLLKSDGSVLEIKMPLDKEGLENLTLRIVGESNKDVVIPIERLMKGEVFYINDEILNINSSKVIKTEGIPQAITRTSPSIASIAIVQTHEPIQQNNVAEQILDSSKICETAEEITCSVKFENFERMAQSKVIKPEGTSFEFEIPFNIDDLDKLTVLQRVENDNEEICLSMESLKKREMHLKITLPLNLTLQLVSKQPSELPLANTTRSTNEREKMTSVAPLSEVNKLKGEPSLPKPNDVTKYIPEKATIVLEIRKSTKDLSQTIFPIETIKDINERPKISKLKMTKSKKNLEDDTNIVYKILVFSHNFYKTKESKILARRSIHSPTNKLPSVGLDCFCDIYKPLSVVMKSVDEPIMSSFSPCKKISRKQEMIPKILKLEESVFGAMGVAGGTSNAPCSYCEVERRKHAMRSNTPGLDEPPNAMFVGQPMMSSQHSINMSMGRVEHCGGEDIITAAINNYEREILPLRRALRQLQRNIQNLDIPTIKYTDIYRRPLTAPIQKTFICEKFPPRPRTSPYCGHQKFTKVVRHRSTRAHDNRVSVGSAPSIHVMSRSPTGRKDQRVGHGELHFTNISVQPSSWADPGMEPSVVTSYKVSVMKDRGHDRKFSPCCGPGDEAGFGAFPSSFQKIDNMGGRKSLFSDPEDVQNIYNYS